MHRLILVLLWLVGIGYCYASDQSCMSCHQASHQQWLVSDHAKSLALPDQATVLGDFNQQTISHHGQSVLFYQHKGQYKVKMTLAGSTDFPVVKYAVKYVVGHHPLQQYVVETEPGRLQVLPFSWDSRDKSSFGKNKGGQRWYFHAAEAADSNYSQRLHWRQPLQNYNGMCADCHSDGVKRHYQPDENRFDTRWDNINVGCLSCHDDKAEQHGKKNDPKTAGGHWLRQGEQKTAQWQRVQGAPRNNHFMDSCFACHSLRTPLVDGFDSNTAFLDQFTPELLGGQMYHADGQIKEEVYVYGSFLQSKMFHAGVNCLDCHDKHTMKLKAQNNGLCLQCHSPQHFDTPKHHGHPADPKGKGKGKSAGAQCVNCHMPNNRYMGVDDRRDHSFKIPRPDLTATFGIPNSCNQCHEHKSSQWAVKQLKAWHGKAKPFSSTKTDLMILNTSGGISESISADRHWQIVADIQLDNISRASALVLLGKRAEPMLVQKLKPYIEDNEPLLRLAAAKAALSVPAVERAELLSPLLQDKLLAIRVAAARSLIGVAVAKVDLAAFEQAFSAMMAAYSINGWRAEGRIEQGVILGSLGEAKEAEKALIAAIKIDPFMAAAYLNLSEYYRMRQQPQQVKKTLLKGLNQLPNAAQISYTYGLYLVRNGGLAQAVEHFKKAMQSAPNEEIYAYTYILALDGSGQGKQALVLLDGLVGKYRDNARLRALRRQLGN